MQFYKYEGFTTNKAWSEENNDRRVMKENIRKIAMKSNFFNEKLQKKLFFYVTNASEDTVTIGIICNNPSNLEKQINAYLKAIQLELKDAVLEEVTFNTAKNMLRYSSNNNYINDDDEVMEQFDLDKISGRFSGIEYGENMIEKTSKKNIYFKAERYLAKDTFIPELDRIYSNQKKSKASGHPVHYMIQTDDSSTRKGMYQALFQALYENGRLNSRRYTFLDFKPGERISTALYDCLYRSSIGGAVVVRYLSNDDSEDDFATGGRETIETICEIMKKYRNKVLTVFCLPRECTQSKSIFYENLANTSIVELKEEFVFGERAENFLRVIAKDMGVRVDKKLISMLEEDKGYLAPELRELFDTWYNKKLKSEIYPQYKEIDTVNKEIVKATPKGSAYDELMEMVGLERAKKVINQALDYNKAQKLLSPKGMKTEKLSMHMVFTGNPGTAKTSVARLVARIMKENGMVSKGTFIEAGRADLVAKYIGWTAPLIQKKFREAQGGILFIDEAYSLCDDRDGLFGDEAINTIVQEMENQRDNVIVIFAGYPDKMEKFLQKNPGLRSRIAFHVPFDDYNTEELCGIAKLIAKKKGLNFTDEAIGKLNGIFDGARTVSDFGNGRYVRNIIEKAKMAQASRLLSMDIDSIKSSDISTLCADDIEVPIAECNQAHKTIGFGM